MNMNIFENAKPGHYVVEISTQSVWYGVAHQQRPVQAPLEY